MSFDELLSDELRKEGIEIRNIRLEDSDEWLHRYMDWFRRCMTHFREAAEKIKEDKDKEPCPHCLGSGKLQDPVHDWVIVTCAICRGSGKKPDNFDKLYGDKR